MSEEGVSRTQAKKQRKELEELGKQIIALPESEIDALPLCERLREAVHEGRRMKKQAYRRQLLFVGRLLSEMGGEVSTIRDHLAGGKERQRAEAAHFHAIELWRDRLLAEGDEAIDELVGEHPSADRQRLRQLVRKAQQEREAERPPSAARRIFKDLRELFETASPASGEAGEKDA